MQSEEEKYYLIDQYLKGKLSEKEETVLKGSFSEDEFSREAAMHRLANEAIEENYLIGIRAATKKVIKRNSVWQKGKWVAGACIITAGIIAYIIYPENEIKQKPAPLSRQVFTKKIEIPQNEQTKPTINNSRTIKSNKNNQTTNLSKPAVQPDINTEEQVYLLPKPGKEELIKPETFTESQPVEKTNPANHVLAPSIGEKEAKKPLKDLTISAKTGAAEFILNPNRDEIIYFPIEEGFDGELNVMDAEGTVILKRQVRNGSPKEWDGKTESGGSITPGQYIFFIKTLSGKEIKQGYITVVR